MKIKESGNFKGHSQNIQKSKSKWSSHSKHAVVFVLLVVLIAVPITSLIISISIGVSQGVMVLEAISAQEDKGDFLPAENHITSGSGSGYYSIYHAKAAFLLSKGVSSTNVALPVGISGPISLGGNAKVYLELYQLMNEICMRDEVNPHIASAWNQSDPLHIECTLGVITPEFLIGKLMSESSMYVDADARCGGVSPTTALYWFTHDFIINSITDSGTSKEEFLKWVGSDSIDKLGFLADYTGRDEPSHFGTVVSAYYDPTPSPGSYAELEARLISELTPCGPYGQLVGMSGNWQSPNNPSAGIYISQLENPDIPDSMRGIWGLREGYYKITEDHDAADYNKFVRSPWQSSQTFLDLEGYFEQGVHAHYINNSKVWAEGPDSCDIAYYSEIATNIRQGNMNLSNPIGWQSRPAVYYLPDSMYTLCMHLRAAMQGARLSTLRYGAATNVYSKYQGVSGITDFAEWNDRILFLAASTQHLPSDASNGGPAHSLVMSTAGRIRDQAKNEYPDSAYCGAFNLRNGETYHPAFKAVIDGLWSVGGYSDTDLQKFVGVYTADQNLGTSNGESEPNYPNGNGDIEIPEWIGSTSKPESPSSSSSSNSKPSSPARPSDTTSGTPSIPEPVIPNLTGTDFVWPLSTSYKRITSIFGKAAGAYGYVATDHGGIDISGSNIGGQSVLAAAPGTVVVASDNCPHNTAKYQVCCGNGLGNYVIIDHGGGVFTTYGHMVPGSVTCREGDRVTAGKKIGEVGTTGHSTGNHLHFAVSYDNILTAQNYMEPLAHTYTNMTLAQLAAATSNEDIAKYLNSYASIGVLPCFNRYGVLSQKRNVVWR